MVRGSILVRVVAKLGGGLLLVLEGRLLSGGFLGRDRLLSGGLLSRGFFHRGLLSGDRLLSGGFLRRGLLGGGGFYSDLHCHSRGFFHGSGRFGRGFFRRLGSGLTLLLLPIVGCTSGGAGGG
jgi:hypothetical protein